jgi:hypothetical protein
MIIMKNDYVQIHYRGTGLKMNLKTMENLYIFIGWRQPEHALKYLALRTMNNSRVLHKTIRKNSCYMKNIRDQIITVLYNKVLMTTIVLTVQ